VILVVAATARELDHADGAETLVCGIGPVEAALATARRLTPGTVDGDVDAVLHVGIAGATSLPTSSVVIGSEAVYCDVLDPASTLARIARIAADPALLERAQRALPAAHVLPIATTARVGGGVGCEVEAMEGFGVLRAAELARVPAVEVRVVSNAVAETDRARWSIADALETLAGVLPVLLEELRA
jgi:futalosine hydrolase